MLLNNQFQPIVEPAGQVSSDNEQRQMMLANSKVVHSRRPLLQPPIAKACSSISEAIFQTRIIYLSVPRKTGQRCFQDFLADFVNKIRGNKIIVKSSLFFPANDLLAYQKDNLYIKVLRSKHRYVDDYENYIFYQAPYTKPFWTICFFFPEHLFHIEFILVYIYSLLQDKVQVGMQIGFAYQSLKVGGLWDFTC